MAEHTSSPTDEHELTMVQRLDKAAYELGSDHTAIITGDKGTLTLGALSMWSHVFGDIMRRHFEPGERFGMLLPTHSESVKVFYGAQRAGAVPLNLSPLLGSYDMIRQMVAIGPSEDEKAAGKYSGPQKIITSKSYLKKLDESFKQSGLKNDIFGILEKVKATGVEIIYLEDEAKSGLNILRTLLSLGEAKIKTTLNQLRGPFTESATLTKPSETPAFMIATSGTTSDPKCIVYSQTNLQEALKSMRIEVPDAGPESLMYMDLPISHIFGSLIAFGGPMEGIPVLLHPSPKEPKVSLDLINEHDADIIFGAPKTIVSKLEADVNGIMEGRTVYHSGNAASDDHRTAFNAAGINHFNWYGASEVSGPSTGRTRYKPSPVKSAGYLLAGFDMKIKPVDGFTPDQGEELGELLVKGPALAMGYMRATAPGEIEPLTDEDGYYHSGDIVRAAYEDGMDEPYLSPVGRANEEFINTDGDRVALQAITQATNDAINTFLPGASDVPEDEIESATIGGGNPELNDRPFYFTTRNIMPDDILEAVQKATGLIETDGENILDIHGKFLPRKNEIYALSPEWFPLTDLRKPALGALKLLYRAAYDLKQEKPDLEIPQAIEEIMDLVVAHTMKVGVEETYGKTMQVLLRRAVQYQKDQAAAGLSPPALIDCLRNVMEGPETLTPETMIPEPPRADDTIALKM